MRTRMLWMFLMLFPLPGLSHTAREMDFVCPIGGEKFKAVMAMPGTSHGRYLDLKPWGPIAAPWPMAKCPGNGFVLYQSKFTDDELNSLREFVASSSYRQAKDVHTPYYLSAMLQKHLGASAERMASTLLQATWEAGPAHYPQYADEALAAFNAFLEKASVGGQGWVNGQLVAGELERRLGRFDEADRRFSMLHAMPDLDARIRAIVEFQRELIAAKNSSPQRMRESVAK